MKNKSIIFGILSCIIIFSAKSSESITQTIKIYPYFFNLFDTNELIQLRIINRQWKEIIEKNYPITKTLPYIKTRFAKFNDPRSFWSSLEIRNLYDEVSMHNRSDTVLSEVIEKSGNTKFYIGETYDKRMWIFHIWSTDYFNRKDICFFFYILNNQEIKNGIESRNLQVCNFEEDAFNKTLEIMEKNIPLHHEVLELVGFNAQLCKRYFQDGRDLQNFIDSVDAAAKEAGL